VTIEKLNPAIPEIDDVRPAQRHMAFALILQKIHFFAQSSQRDEDFAIGLAKVVIG